MAWLRELFGLGEAHSGAFVTGAAVSNTVGLAIAREWLGERLGVDVSRDGAAALGPVDVLSGSPHSSGPKALSVLGVGRGRDRVDALARAVAASGEAFLTPTVYAGVPALRAAFSNWRTTQADVRRVLDALAATSF